MSETEDYEKQRLATLRRLKRGDENELERSLRLEKMVASKHLRLAVETEEERRARLENDSATKRLSLAMETEEDKKQDWRRWQLPVQAGHREGRRKKNKTGEAGSYHTAQVGPGDRGRKKIIKRNGFDFDLIWIEVGFFKNSRNELTRPVMGTIFLVCVCVCVSNEILGEKDLHKYGIWPHHHTHKDWRI